MGRDIDSNRPGIGETVFAALGMIHSTFALPFSWLVLALAGGAWTYYISALAPSFVLQIPGYLLYGLAAVFVGAGYMGSLHLLLTLRGWSLVSVIECGRRYFGRFLLLGLIQFVLLMLIPLLAGVLVAIAVGVVHPLFVILMIPLFIGMLVLGIFLVFARPGVVVKEKGVLDAISFSFRVVRRNFLPAVTFVLIFSVPPYLLAYLIKKLYGGALEFPRILLSTLITAYGNLLLMAALVYFTVEIGKPPEQTI